jgi:hypothetical protein
MSVKFFNVGARYEVPPKEWNGTKRRLKWEFGCCSSSVSSKPWRKSIRFSRFCPRKVLQLWLRGDWVSIGFVGEDSLVYTIILDKSLLDIYPHNRTYTDFEGPGLETTKVVCCTNALKLSAPLLAIASSAAGPELLSVTSSRFSLRILDETRIKAIWLSMNLSYKLVKGIRTNFLALMPV